MELIEYWNPDGSNVDVTINDHATIPAGTRIDQFATVAVAKDGSIEPSSDIW